MADLTLISARDIEDGTELVYTSSDMGQAVFRYQVSRIVIGISFPEDERASGHIYPGFLSVVGERMFFAKTPGARNESIYVALDEEEDMQAHTLFSKLIALKDRYAVRGVYCPAGDQAMMETLRRIEGLTHYNSGRHATECRQLWPTFISKQQVAAVREAKLSDEPMDRDLEALATTKALHPDTGEPIFDRDFRPTSRLLLPDGFPNHRTRDGVMSNTRQACRALWLAVMGMERSGRKYAGPSSGEHYVHTPDSRTGY